MTLQRSILRVSRGHTRKVDYSSHYDGFANTIVVCYCYDYIVIPIMSSFRYLLFFQFGVSGFEGLAVEVPGLRGLGV